MSDRPIADHALLSDCQSAALVDRDGSVEWLCFPRFDSPSVFARLLDDGDGGHFSVRPTGDAEVTRRYIDGSLVLVTTFETSDGVVELTDALAMAESVRGHDLGDGSPHVLLRRAVCTEGQVDLAVSFAPRYEYGLTTPLVREVDGGVIARGGPVALRLSTDVPLVVEGPVVHATVSLSAGESVSFAVSYGSSWQPSSEPWSPEQVADRLDDTVAAWRSWKEQHQRYEGPYADLVDHSGRVLQGLTFQPTGAIVAAATTSLPEVVGGERNWDYRYAWVRDASFTLDALWVAACPDESRAFLDYLTTAASSVYRRRELQIMFGVGGERDLSERELNHLSGWRDSRPVRVGNGAWQQEQLDVYGELLAAVHRLRDQLSDLDDQEQRFLVTLADTAAEVWTETDHGIWEIRGEPHHYLYSKLMCWVALDRAIDLAGALDASDRIEAWKRTRDEVRQAILDRGWSDEAGAFTQAFGTTDLDASNLVISIVGFLPADDERVLATIDATAERLTDEHGLVYRYRAHDGLAGEEGSFLLCTFWLAEAYARSGQTERAREVFERAVGFVNDVGLLSEEVAPESGELIGNFPQAFSHIGLINAAWAIAQAQQGTAAGDDRPGD
ncbi:MAG: glycoside hydrolase family 15 protein [Actinobacteria bacterium]|nr:glycoside hydrolase family 15 protein [Actinomycetota bacterium]